MAVPAIKDSSVRASGDHEFPFECKVREFFGCCDGCFCLRGRDDSICDTPRRPGSRAIGSLPAGERGPVEQRLSLLDLGRCREIKITPD
jgi:hypothetical protein